MKGNDPLVARPGRRRARRRAPRRRRPHARARGAHRPRSRRRRRRRATAAEAPKRARRSVAAVLERGAEPAVHDRAPRRRGPRRGRAHRRRRRARIVAVPRRPARHDRRSCSSPAAARSPPRSPKKLKEVKARASARPTARRPSDVLADRGTGGERAAAARRRQARRRAPRRGRRPGRLRSSRCSRAAYGAGADARRRRRRAVPRRGRRGARRTSSPTRSRRATPRARSRCCTGCSRVPSRAAAQADAPAPGARHAPRLLPPAAAARRRIAAIERPTRSPRSAAGSRTYPARKALDQARALGTDGIRQAFDALLPGRPRPQGRARHPRGRGDGGARGAPGSPLHGRAAAGAGRARRSLSAACLASARRRRWPRFIGARCGGRPAFLWIRPLAAALSRRFCATRTASGASSAPASIASRAFLTGSSARSARPGCAGAGARSSGCA